MQFLKLLFKEDELKTKLVQLFLSGALDVPSLL